MYFWLVPTNWSLINIFTSCKSALTINTPVLGACITRGTRCERVGIVGLVSLSRLWWFRVVLAACSVFLTRIAPALIGRLDKSNQFCF